MQFRAECATILAVVRTFLRALIALCMLFSSAAIIPDRAAAQSTPDSAASAIPTDPALLPDQHSTTVETPFSPPSPFVTVELSSALGGDAAEIGKMLAGVPFVRIAKPADFMLTTKPEFTQTLMLVDGEDGERRLGGAASDADFPIDSRPPITLGNLALQDYERPLSTALARVARAKALLAAETPPQKARTMMCARVGGDTSPSTCLIPGQPWDAQESDHFLKVGFDARMLLAVRNTSSQPMYLYLLGVDPQFGVRHFALLNGGLTDAGAWAESKPDSWPTYIGPYHFQFVTIASPAPIPSATVDQWILDDGGVVATVDGAARGWSISTFNFAFAGPIVGGVGNGLAVPPFRAPWAVQLYATVPYTEAQLRQDDQQPPGTRKYLRQRTEVEREHSCGGTLIAENFVLTAAHCVASGLFAGDGKALVFKRRRVRAGTHQLGVSGATYAIDGVAVAAGYQGDRPGSPDDIALLLLKADRGTRPVSDRFAAPIAVAGRARAAAEKVAVYGWGVTAAVDAGANWVGTGKNNVNRNPDFLQFGTMQTLGWNACRTQLKTLLGNGMLCAVPITNPKTGRADRPVFSCVGDSGGPLIGREAGDEVLVGIVSWSKGCGVKGSPDVYTDVAHYSRWVNTARASLKSGDYIFVPAPPTALTR